MNSFQLLKRIIKKGRRYIPVFLILTCTGFILLPVEFYGLILSRKLIDLAQSGREKVWKKIGKIGFHDQKKDKRS